MKKSEHSTNCCDYSKVETLIKCFFRDFNKSKINHFNKDVRTCILNQILITQQRHEQQQNHEIVGMTYDGRDFVARLANGKYIRLGHEKGADMWEHYMNDSRMEMSQTLGNDNTYRQALYIRAHRDKYGEPGV